MKLDSHLAMAPPLRRIDPRRPAVLGAGGLRRIVLGGSEGEPLLVARPMAPAAKPLRCSGPFSQRTIVATHAERGALSDAAREAVAAAATLADAETEVLVLVLGACDDDAAALGIDRLLALGDFDPLRYQPSACVQWLLDMHRAWTPRRWFFADGGADGQLGRRFAIAAGLDLACGVVALEHEMLRVPAGVGDDWLRPHAEVMLLTQGVASSRLPFAGLGRRESAPPLPDRSEHGIEDLGVDFGNPELLPLEEADLIVAAGNGVHDLELFHALARTLGAAVGASRVAVDDGRFGRHQQVGATGKTVAASGYLAFGISGAVQHLQGIKDCRHVIAVNLDAAAPIVRRADLTLVEDGAALMRALIELLREDEAKEAA